MLASDFSGAFFCVKIGLTLNLFVRNIDFFGVICKIKVINDNYFTKSNINTLYFCIKGMIL